LLHTRVGVQVEPSGGLHDRARYYTLRS